MSTLPDERRRFLSVLEESRRSAGFKQSPYEHRRAFQKRISDECMIAKTDFALLALQLLSEIFKLTEIARAIVKDSAQRPDRCTYRGSHPARQKNLWLNT